MKQQYELTAAALKGAKSALIISHYNPDPDAISSTTSTSELLRQLGVNTVMLNHNSIDSRYYFIPGARQIINTLPQGEFDLVVVVDSATIERVGESFLSKIKAHKRLINIDHHRTNSKFGAVNLVDESASSCCEVLFNLSKYLNTKIDSELATALLTGIVSDTGSFRYSNTTSATLKMAAELCEAGANLRTISSNLFERKSKEATLLQSALLSNLSFFNQGRVAWINCSLEELRRSKAHSDDLDPVVEEARCVDGVEIAVLCREQESTSVQRWRVSLRGKGEGVDLGAIAKRFNGGGHKSAAGFFYEGEKETLQRRILEML